MTISEKSAGNNSISQPANRWLNLAAPVLAVPGALAALILLFFNKMAFSNLILARGDTFLYFYPYWQVAADALRDGRVPLWNPDIFMGAPFLANSQVGFFYPFNWPVWLLLPTPYAVSASILLHLSIAGLGAYLAGRRTLALSRAAALFSAALFALGGYLTAQVEHINQLQGLAWLPWYFAALAPLTACAPPAGRRQMCRTSLAVGALLALQLLAGHTQTAFFSIVAVALWLIAHALVSRQRRDKARGVSVIGRAALVVGMGVVLAALLAAVQLLPTLELAAQSSRQGGLPLNEVLSFSWHPLHLTRALLPAYGPALFSEYVAFFPLTALILAVIGAWGWRNNPAVLPWVVLAVIVVVLAFGRFTPVYYLLGRLPGFDLFRAPARWLAVATLAAALLAGYGWERLRRFARADLAADERRVAVRRGFLRWLVVAVFALLALIAWGYIAGWVAQWLPTGAEAPYEPPPPLALLGWLIELALASLLLWAILTAPPERAGRATVELCVLALAVLWLGSRALPYNQLTTPEAYFDWRPPPARLAALAACTVPERHCANPPARFLSLSDILFDPGDLAEIEAMYADQLDPAAIYDYVVAVKHKEVLSPNLSMIPGLPSIDGFDGGILPLQSYSALMGLILPEGTATTDGRLREYLSVAPDSRWLALFNGRYLITDKTGDLWREGVFFDRQHPARVAAAPITLSEIPAYEATELWMLAGESPPEVEIKTAAGEVWQLTPKLWSAPDLYRLPYPQAGVAAAISLLPCRDAPDVCGADALTLVDTRDETFQPLTLPPYRLIFSGDVKLYENLDVLPRVFMVYDWQGAADAAAAVEAMRAGEFDPARSAVVVGDNVPAPASFAAAGSAEIIAYHPEAISLRVSTEASGLLVLTDAFYPGWEVTLNGAPAPIEQVNALFRGIFLPPGEHEVEMVFRPVSYRNGMWMSAAGLGLLISGWALALYDHRRPKRKAVN